ncbi:MAG: transglutaminase-like domain-containing protein [Pseudomonadota bacterium]|nr:transglutaminase-like domain-containing protein [Pseudomonadota bacterium]
MNEEGMKTSQADLSSCLKSTYFIDSGNVAVKDFAQRQAGSGSDLERGVRLYYAVRDSIRYDPYGIGRKPEDYRASLCLKQETGFCITKAALLAACARAVGIPSRVGYGDVRNHLATPKLLDLLRTDEFVFHGYTELFLDGVWVKATPAFNISLCERFGVLPLEFNGWEDSLFHPYDSLGRRHMEYIRERGSFPDVPFEDIMEAFWEYYPTAMETGFNTSGGDFAAEAARRS